MGPFDIHPLNFSASLTKPQQHQHLNLSPLDSKHPRHHPTSPPPPLGSPFSVNNKSVQRTLDSSSSGTRLQFHIFDPQRLLLLLSRTETMELVRKLYSRITHELIFLSSVHPFSPVHRICFGKWWISVCFGCVLRVWQKQSFCNKS
uniref:Uncharacterized protein n=1 Tax=Lactuca sativa TaxID=4236 RepID=A0A9R1W8I1_LACSA|nr:hypothetical protein LSAT_V11C200063340 [Lactuca sativa]